MINIYQKNDVLVPMLESVPYLVQAVAHLIILIEDLLKLLNTLSSDPSIISTTDPHAMSETPTGILVFV